MTKEQIKEAVVKAWQKTPYSYNSDLSEVIINEIWKADTTPNLGCASTLMLITELDARVRTAASAGEEWPKYRTVDNSL